MRRLVLTDRLYPDVFCFLDLLAEQFGDRADAAAAFVRSSEIFQEWRARVAYCEHCERYVPIKHGPKSPQKRKHRLRDYHRIPNPGTRPPFYITCPGSNHYADPALEPNTPTRQVRMTLARIRHCVKQVQADLL